MPLEDYPELPTAGTQIATIPAQALYRALAQVRSFALSAKEASRRNLTGVFFELGKARATATNGYRLGTTTLRDLHVPLSEGPDRHIEFILPADQLKPFVTELKKLRGEVEIFMRSETRRYEHIEGQPEVMEVKDVVFKLGEHQWLFRTIDEEYPDFERVIPDKLLGVATLDRAKFEQALKQVQPFAPAENDGVTLTFDTDGLALVLGASSAEKGEATASVAIEKITRFGEPLRYCFKASYLLDFLKVVKPFADQVLFHLPEDAKSAALLSDADGELTYVVMPIRMD
jgi:DNA polymerase III sliding clamp (beta) subunit (PCNA family)